MKFYKLLLLLLIVSSCKNEPDQQLPEIIEPKLIELKYAKGFTIEQIDDYFTIITIKKPWPNAEKEYSYTFSNSKITTDQLGNEKKFSIPLGITTPLKRIVVTSTTHIPALELLGEEQTLVGFPGTDYISSEKTRKLIDQGNVRELGKNEGVNTEVLLELNPDLVIAFGVDGVNKTFEVAKKAGIPIIYNGDWVESSALAKAEWIKLFGVLYHKEKEADSIFNTIEKEYLKAKEIAKKAKNRPTVLSGAMNKDVWNLPNGSSAEGQFLKDANVNYLWSETTGNGSLALSYEVVLNKAKDAEIWINPSYYGSFDQLEKASSLYSHFESFKQKNIYTFANKTGATGGVLYYELGTARPDLVLKDLIKITHPDLLIDYKPYFFEKLK